MSVDKFPTWKQSARKTKVGIDGKEVKESEIKWARFSTIVEETISTKPGDFLHADRDLEYIYFCSNTESKTDSESDSDVFL